jgi:hypothetical protein
LHHLVVSKKENEGEKINREKGSKDGSKRGEKELNKQRKKSIVMENKEEGKETNRFYN